MNRNLRNALLGLGAGAIAAPAAGLGVGPSLMKLQTMLPESKSIKNLLAEMSYIDIRDALLGRPTSGVPEIINYGVEELKPFKNKHLFGSLKASQLVDKLLGKEPVPASILSGGIMPSTLAESVRDRLIKGNLALAGGGATLGGILGALSEPSESEKVSSANFTKQAKMSRAAKGALAAPVALLAAGPLLAKAGLGSDIAELANKYHYRLGNSPIMYGPLKLMDSLGAVKQLGVPGKGLFTPTSTLTPGLITASGAGAGVGKLSDILSNLKLKVVPVEAAKKELLSKSIFNTLSKNPAAVVLPLALLAGGTGYLLGRDSDS
tara:strand:- start:765 stop:1727 length:963 start_codon:yes stop_codon:yes gene_type:complete